MGSAASKSTSTSNLDENDHQKNFSRQFLNDHVHQLLKGLTILQNQASLCDITICAQERDKGPLNRYPAHKCLLAASSPYFREKLGVSCKGFDDTGTNNKTHATSYEHDTNHVTASSSLTEITLDFPLPKATMESVLRFMYSAVLDVKQENIPSLIEAAVKLKLSSLTKRCFAAVKSNFRWSYVGKLLHLSHELDLPELRDFVLRKSIDDLDDFTESERFLKLKESDLQELINYRKSFLSDFCSVPELQIFNAILKWEKQEMKRRREAAQGLLKRLDYTKMPQSTLFGYILAQEIVASDSELRGKIEDVLGFDKKRILKRLRSQSFNSTANVGSGDEIRPIRRALVITGGRLFDQFTCQVQELNMKEECWKEVTRLPTSLSHHSVTVVGNLLYVCGGENSAIAGVRGLASFCTYDPMENEWETLPDMQQGRAYFYLGSNETHLYAIGGKSSKTNRTSVEKYNIVNKKWEFAACLKQPRYSHSGCAYKQVFYVSGGVVRKMSTSDLLKFDPFRNHWEVVASMKAERSNHSMARVRDRIFAIGGEVESQGVSEQVSVEIECYVPQCNQWHKVGQKISFQSGKECACAELNGLIYVVGGCRTNVTDYRHDVASYDPEKDIWKVNYKLPRRMRGAACAVLQLR